jgi:hypothetical protein
MALIQPLLLHRKFREKRIYFKLTQNVIFFKIIFPQSQGQAYSHYLQSFIELILNPKIFPSDCLTILHNYLEDHNIPEELKPEFNDFKT